MVVVFGGKNAVNGIAIGRVKRLDIDMEKPLSDYNQGSNEEEESKYFSARKAAEKEINRTIEVAKEKGMKEQLSIMETHLIIIFDPVLEAAIIEKIKQSLPAPVAVLKASEETARLISSLDDIYLRERASDIKDVGKKIAGLLLGVKQPDFSESNVIICGDEIEPSIIASIPEGKVSGIIMGNGSITSHAVIIAKAKGIATVVGMGEKLKKLDDGTEIILDANLGEIIVNADDELMKEYGLKLEKEKRQLEYYLSLSKIPAITKDGVRVTLAANIGNPQDIDFVMKYGCDGVGLFRTEFVFMGRSDLPSEEDQFEAYRYVIEKCAGKLCVIRTMDIGGDKPLPYLEIGKEENPFLGWRAIRISLERTEIFITQIKAILRAGVFGKVAIMLPMIIQVEEVQKAKLLISQAIEELEAEGKEFSKDVQTGIMIETPAAAVMADVLAKECSFFSIGTNDLVQYTLAVDRGNSNVSGLYSHFNPAVLRLIDGIIKAAHSNNIWVGMCGEMAGDPLAAQMLVAMGIDELSMSVSSIPKVKEMILNTIIEKGVVQKVLSMNHTRDIVEYLRSNLENTKTA